MIHPDSIYQLLESIIKILSYQIFNAFKKRQAHLRIFVLMKFSKLMMVILSIPHFLIVSFLQHSYLIQYQGLLHTLFIPIHISILHYFDCKFAQSPRILLTINSNFKYQHRNHLVLILISIPFSLLIQWFFLIITFYLDSYIMFCFY